MLNLWYTLFAALWSVELEKLCLFTLKGQAHKEEPDLTSWKRADLQPTDPIMNKMQQQKWRSATKHKERDLLFFYWERKTMLLIVLVRAQHSWQGGSEPLPQSTRQTISDWCGKGKTALSHAGGSVWEPLSSSFLHRELNSGKAAFPTGCPQFFCWKLTAGCAKQWESPDPAMNSGSGRMDFCLQLFSEQQAAAHRSVVTSTELARWPRPWAFWEIIPFWNCGGLTALQNGEISNKSQYL